VIIKAMQQEPAQRFQNAEAMRMALAQCLPSGTVVAPTTVQIPALSPNSTIVVPPHATPVQGVNPVCPKCGYINRPGAKFCKRDGQPLTQGATSVPPQVARQPLRARPVQGVSIQARPVQPSSIQARPVQGSIQARPVSTPDVQSAYRQGLQCLHAKKYAEAIAQFKQASASGQQPSYEIAYGLGRAYRQHAASFKGNNHGQYRENLTLAIEQFEQAVKLKPDSVDANFQLGLSYHDLDLYDQANLAFQKVQQLTPRDAAVSFQLGRVAMDQGYNLEAEAYFLEGLKLNPNHALILAALGRLYLKMNQTTSAINVLRQATQIEPLMWEGWHDLGRAHMKAREWKVALSALEQARQANPDGDEIYSAMATCYLKMNKKAEARQMVHQALMINPSNNEATRLQKQL
jgi:tetratricopeptide (TPR) repeat protein